MNKDNRCILYCRYIEKEDEKLSNIKEIEKYKI